MSMNVLYVGPYFIAPDDRNTGVPLELSALAGDWEKRVEEVNDGMRAKWLPLYMSKPWTWILHAKPENDIELSPEIITQQSVQFSQEMETLALAVQQTCGVRPVLRFGVVAVPD